MKIVLRDAAATAALGAALAPVLLGRPGTVVFLHGDLGAGKTTVARGLLQALGVAGAIRSPTYTLIEPYTVAGREVLHADLYRLNDAQELHQLGLVDDASAQALWLVEWPERGAGVLPPPDISLALSHFESGRLAALSGLDVEEIETIRTQLAGHIV